MRFNFRNMGQVKLKVSAAGIEKIPLVQLGEPQVERGVSKDAGGGREFKVDAPEVPFSEYYYDRS